MPPFPIVAVLAEDWAGFRFATEHYSLDEINEMEPVEGWICGMLVKKTDRIIIICRDYFESNQHFRCPLTIPRPVVKSIIYLVPEIKPKNKKGKRKKEK